MTESSERSLGRIESRLEQGQLDRAEMRRLLDEIREQVFTINGRTRKLEDRVDAHDVIAKNLAEQLGKMVEPVQLISSSIHTLKTWGWRLVLLGGLLMSVGNQVASKIFEAIWKTFMP